MLTESVDETLTTDSDFEVGRFHYMLSKEFSVVNCVEVAFSDDNKFIFIRIIY